MGKETQEDVVSELEEMLGLGDDDTGVIPDEVIGDKEAVEIDTVPATATTDAAMLQDQNEITKNILKIDLQIEALGAGAVDMEPFYSNIETHLSEEEQALEFENKSAYMKLIAQKAKEYEAKNSNTDTIASLQEQKKELENVYARSAAVMAVSTKYPDFNYEAVHSFFENKLNKEQQAAVYEKSTSYADVYENAYKLFIEANPSNIHTQNSPKIPNLNNVRKQNVTDKVVAEGFDSDDEKLRAALGL